jgi:hypothetical protein
VSPSGVALSAIISSFICSVSARIINEEIFKIYDQMHQEYKETQGLTNWINLYDGYRSKFYLDVGDDDLHPGYKSNKKFAEFLSAQFKY